MRGGKPDAFETIFGRKLAPGESFVKDRRAFEQRHAGDWISIAALRSDHHPGMTEVIATIGGQRGDGRQEQRFLVPSDEYAVTPFGFVVDPVRHSVDDGPSSFLPRSAGARR